MEMVVSLQKLLRLLGYMVLSLFYWFSYLVPKDSDLWIFGAWGGKKFADNPKYLFLYMCENEPNVRPVWLSRNLKVVKQLRDCGYESYHSYGIKGILLSLKASVVVVSHGLCDVNMFLIGGSRWVQLWHGIPLKKIVYDDVARYKYMKENSIIGYVMRTIYKILPFVGHNYAMCISTSIESQKTISSAFRMEKSRVPVTGYPRNDIFVGANYAERFEICSGSMRYFSGSRRVIAYLPTYRDNPEINIYRDYGFDLFKIQDFLEKHNAVLWIKPHPSDRNLIFDEIESTPSNVIIVLDQDLPDIYPLLEYTNILITDYSSVFFDYLLLDRPIVFAPFDLHDYVSSRGLYYEYENVTPGPKAKNWDEVLKYVEEAIYTPSKYGREREKVRNMFHEYQDGMSSERIYVEILKLLDSR